VIDHTCPASNQYTVADPVKVGVYEFPNFVEVNEGAVGEPEETEYDNVKLN
jgi:hypothetical protein